ncbi:hypothetical protein ACH347_14780 [Saccharopolyspora sp. 5N102]|uniref:hypothetical protein n=1 Tax=Saccharopolyspora sp. 5N102 TaxID=3375155 RepID=UPI0037B9E792
MDEQCELPPHRGERGHGVGELVQLFLARAGRRRGIGLHLLQCRDRVADAVESREQSPGELPDAQHRRRDGRQPCGGGRAGGTERGQPCGQQADDVEGSFRSLDVGAHGDLLAVQRFGALAEFLQLRAGDGGVGLHRQLDVAPLRLSLSDLHLRPRDVGVNLHLNAALLSCELVQLGFGLGDLRSDVDLLLVALLDQRDDLPADRDHVSLDRHHPGTTLGGQLLDACPSLVGGRDDVDLGRELLRRE